jgi:hypothetical protein
MTSLLSGIFVLLVTFFAVRNKFVDWPTNLNEET